MVKSKGISGSIFLHLQSFDENSLGHAISFLLGQWGILGNFFSPGKVFVKKKKIESKIFFLLNKFLRYEHKQVNPSTKTMKSSIRLGHLGSGIPSQIQDTAG